MHRLTVPFLHDFQQSILSAANSALEADAELQAFVNLIDSRPTLAAPLTLGSSSFLSPTSTASPPALSRVSLTSGAPSTTKSQLSEALKRMAASYTGFGPASSGTVPEGIESSSSPHSPTSPTSRSPDPSSLHLNISPPTHKRPLLGATSPIAPSPLRASTEAPPPPPSSHTPSFPKSSPLAGPSSSTTTTSSTVTSPFPHTIHLPSSTNGSLRSPRERKAPVLVRGGFGSFDDHTNNAADVPLPSSHDGRWSPNPLGSPNALSAMSTSPGFLRSGTANAGFGLSRDGSRSPSVVGTLPSSSSAAAAHHSRTPSHSPGPTLSRQHHPSFGGVGSRPPPASPLSSSPTGTVPSFSLSEAASPRFGAARAGTGRQAEDEEDDVLGRFELDEEPEPEEHRHAALHHQGQRSGSVGRRAGTGVEYGDVGGVMGRGGWPAGYGRSG